VKILFLNPIIIYESWPFASDFWRHMMGVIGITYPQLAAVIPNDDVAIFDGFTERIEHSDYIRLLLNYDIIAITAVSSVTALNIEANIKLIKMLAKEVKVILGGHHATFYAKEWLEKGADIIILNEGEQTFKETIAVLKQKGDLSKVNGIAFRIEKEIIYTQRRPLIKNLDTLPMPKWDLIRFQLYQNVFGNKQPCAAIETSRGCSFGCVFCCVHTMWEGMQRYKSIDRVVEEFNILKQRGAKNIFIADDNFGSNMLRDREILEKIIDLNVNLWMFCRADTVFNNPEFILLASRAGLKEVFVGFEDVSDEGLEFYHKGMDDIDAISHYKQAYEILHRNNILVLGSFVANPLNNKRSKKNIAISYNSICDVALHLNIIPMKGTKIYEELMRQNKLCGDTFYADRMLCVFNDYNIQKGCVLFWKSLSGLINIKVLKLLFTFSKCKIWHRRRLCHIFGCLFKNVSNISFSKIKFLIIFLSPYLSPQIKQQKMRNEYLNKQFLSDFIISKDI